VQPEQTLDIDRLAAEKGATVEFRDVLLIGGNGETQVGSPFVEGARVIAEVVEHGRDKKLLVFKYKNKTRYRRRHGHRQGFTRLLIRQVLTERREPAEVVEEKPKRAPRKRATPRAKAGTPPADAAVAAETTIETVEAAASDAQIVESPKPKRARAPKPAAAEESGAEAPVADAAEARPRRPRTRKKTDSGE
jgi:large subunit ribosomal protein L21